MIAAAFVAGVVAGVAATLLYLLPHHSSGLITDEERGNYRLTCADCGQRFERPSACEDEDICQRCGEQLEDADAVDVEVA